MIGPDRNRRRPILAGTAAACVVAVLGFVLFEDGAWWLRTWRTEEVLVIEQTLGSTHLRDKAALNTAVEATRTLIRKLEPMPPRESYLVGYSSEVIFCKLGDPKTRFLRLTWDHLIDEAHARISVDGRHMICKQSDWQTYLGDLLKPLTHEFLTEWRSRTGRGGDRFRAAAALALTAPDTDGLTEFFCIRLEAGEEQALRCLWWMGPSAAGAIPRLEARYQAMAGKAGSLDELQDLEKVLGRVRGKP